MNESQTITIRINPKVFQGFKEYCDRQNNSMSATLRDYIKDTINWIEEVNTKEHFLEYLADNGKDFYFSLSDLAIDLGLSRYLMEKHRKDIYKIYKRSPRRFLTKIVTQDNVEIG